MIFARLRFDPRWRSAAALVICLAATFALHGRALRAGWFGDDMQILLQAIDHPPAAYFFDPAVWQQLIIFSLTPWLTFSFDVDHALFGLDVAAYHAHSLLALGIAAWLIQRLASRWSSDRVAMALALLFLVGAPAAQLAQWLMVRHYAEGLIAWLAAMLVVQRRLQQATALNAGGAALAFAIAASAKEVFIPLGLLPLLIPRAPWRARLRAAAPLIAVMVLYVPWRAYMLGDLVGGYVPKEELPSPWGPAALAQWALAPALVFRHPAWAAAALAAIAAAAIYAARHSTIADWLRRTIIAGVVVALLAMPVLPATVYPGLGPDSERLMLAPWAVLTLAMAPLLAQAGRALPGQRIATAATWLLVAAIAVSAWQTTRRMNQRIGSQMAEYGAHYRLLVEGEGADWLIPSETVSPFFLQGAQLLRSRVGTAPPPHLLHDPAFGPAAGTAGDQRIWRYDATQRRLVDARGGFDAAASAWRASIRSSPISVRFSFGFETRALRWQLGPAAGPAGSARFSIVLPDRRLATSPTGVVRQGDPVSECFRIRRDDADGTIAYTPWLRMSERLPGEVRVRWEGPGVSAGELAAQQNCESPRAADAGR